MPPTPGSAHGNGNAHDDLEKIAQDFVLPAVVQADVESYEKVANTLAITSSLFAAVEIALAQIIESKLPEPLTPAWEVLRWCTYAAVLVTLGCTAAAISVINITSSMSNRSRGKILNDKKSVPRKYVNGTSLSNNELQPESVRHRMEHFGVPRRFFPLITRCMLGSFMLGTLLMFLSFCIWVGLTQSKGATAALAVIATPVLLLALSVAAH
ncbi:hypothetical protein CPB86DRAFT_782458 [Serendipita vermifera]|nr:hypothetical protein CPB86DRAFT_782458 [Serendipita vermifera]